MKMDKKYSKKILIALMNHPSQQMRFYMLAHAVGLMSGNIEDPPSMKINEDQINKFRGHISYLNNEEKIICSDSKLGISYGANGHPIINSGAIYQLTSIGQTYIEETTEPIIKKIAKKSLEVSGKIFWMFWGGALTILGEYAGELITALIKNYSQ